MMMLKSRFAFLALLLIGAGAALGAGIQPEEGEVLSDTGLISAIPISLAEVGDLLLRLVVAAAIGAILAMHPLRRRTGGKGKRAVRMVQTQIILTVAAALMVIIIGDSFERAMGLVGLGSFIRFRNVVSSPVETALIFVHIGLGMACGLGQYAIAAVGGAAFLVLLIPVLYFGRADSEEDRPDDPESGVAGPLLSLKLRGADVSMLAGCVEDVVDDRPEATLVRMRQRHDVGRLQASIRIQSSAAVEPWISDLRTRLGGAAHDLEWAIEEEGV